MALKDYAGKHSSEWPPIGSQHDSVILGVFANPPKPLQLVEIGPNRDVVLCVPNRKLGGADAVIVVSDDGVWVKGLDELIKKRVEQRITLGGFDDLITHRVLEILGKLPTGELAKLLNTAHERGE